MPVQIPTSPPSEIQAGDTLIFTLPEQGDDYPGADWAISYVLAKNGTNAITANGAWSVSDEEYTVTASATDTANLQPGRYQFAVIITSSTARYTVDSGSVTVKPNLAADRTPTDSEAMLLALDAAILILVADPNSSASFNGQSYTSRNLGEMFTARNVLRKTVAAERAQLDGVPNWQTIHTRFC